MCELGSSNILTLLEMDIDFPLYGLNDRSVSLWFHSYVPNPVLVIIDVQPKELGIPTKAYYAVEEVKEVRTKDVIIVFYLCGAWSISYIVALILLNFFLRHAVKIT